MNGLLYVDRYLGGRWIGSGPGLGRRESSHNGARAAPSKRAGETYGELMGATVGACRALANGDTGVESYKQRNAVDCLQLPLSYSKRRPRDDARFAIEK